MHCPCTRLRCPQRVAQRIGHQVFANHDGAAKRFLKHLFRAGRNHFPGSSNLLVSGAVHCFVLGLCAFGLTHLPLLHQHIHCLLVEVVRKALFNDTTQLLAD